MNLPESSKSHEQEDTSRQKFISLIPKSKFIVREEIKHDYGVDLVLEAKLHRRYISNYRIHLQLKSKQRPRKNRDGSFSYPIDMDNLNYLYNQPGSIYVIYLEDEDVFMWEWVNEIVKISVINEIDLLSTTQKTFTYRFKKQFDLKSIDNIHSQIVSLGKIIRDFGKSVMTFSKKVLNISLKEELDIDEGELVGAYKQSIADANSYISKGKYQEAFNIYNSISGIIKREKVFIKCSILALLLNKNNKSINFANKALEINYKNYYALFLKGLCYTNIKKYDKSIKYLREAIRYNNEVPDIYKALGKALWLNGDIKESINTLEKTLSLNESDVETKLYLGVIYSNMFRADMALIYLDEVLNVESDNHMALSNKGKVLKYLGKYDEAIAFFRKALKYNKDSYTALIGMGLTLIDKNRIREASLYIVRWLVKYHIDFMEGYKNDTLLLVDLDWENIKTVSVCINSKKIISLIIGETEQIIRTPELDNEVIIGISGKDGYDSTLPIIGKKYMLHEDFEYVLDQIKENTNIWEAFPWRSQYVDKENETSLLIKRLNKNDTYFEINFNEFMIIGLTDKVKVHSINFEAQSGAEAFIQRYKETGCFQVSLFDMEKKSQFNLVVTNGKVEIG